MGRRLRRGGRGRFRGGRLSWFGENVWRGGLGLINVLSWWGKIATVFALLLASLPAPHLMTVLVLGQPADSTRWDTHTHMYTQTLIHGTVSTRHDVCKAPS